MNKTLLSTALLTLLSATTYADNNPQPIPALAKPTAPLAAPAAATPDQATPTSAPAPQAPPVIDCKYHIPANQASIEPSLLSTWASKAAVQSFDFNPSRIDDELNDLKSCYTEQGWQGFNDALKKSGNIDAIKSQHLTVSSQVVGELKTNPVKDNQWKISVPLQVVYQNDKEKLTQLLTVDLLIGRKISGDLGIMQMIAGPQETAHPNQPEDAQTASSSVAPEAKPTSSAPQSATEPSTRSNGPTPTVQGPGAKLPAAATPPKG